MDPFVRRYQPERWDDWRRGLDRAPHPEDDRAPKPASPRSPFSGSASAAPSRRPSLALSTASEIPTYSATVPYPDSASSSASSSSPNSSKPKAGKRAPSRAKDSKVAAQSGKKARARAGRRPRAVSAASASDPTPGVEAAPVSAQVSTDTAFSLPLDSPMISKSIADLTAAGTPLPQSDTFTSPGFLSIADLVKLYCLSF